MTRELKVGPNDNKVQTNVGQVFEKSGYLPYISAKISKLTSGEYHWGDI